MDTRPIARSGRALERASRAEAARAARAIRHEDWVAVWLATLALAAAVALGPSLNLVIDLLALPGWAILALHGPFVLALLLALRQRLLLADLAYSVEALAALGTRPGVAGTAEDGRAQRAAVEAERRRVRRGARLLYASLVAGATCAAVALAYGPGVPDEPASEEIRYVPAVSSSPCGAAPPRAGRAA